MKEISFAKTSYYAILSQIVSIGVSFVTTLLLPKVLSVDDFGFYQLFILYASYVGLAHLGFNDGVYLKLGGKRFEDVDKTEWGNRYIAVIIMLMFFSLSIFVFSVFCLNNQYRYVGAFVAVFLFFENIYILLNLHLIATAHMEKYSKAVILSKITFLLLVLSTLLFESLRNFYYISISYITVQILALGYVARYFEGYFKTHSFLKSNKTVVCKQVLVCVMAGLPLTISNLLSNFIIGSGRIVIERIWSIDIFAKISLTMTLNVFLLTFISQISYVLFPFLRRTNDEIQRTLLNDFVVILGYFVLICLIMYVPLYWFIDIYLPQYKEGAYFLFMLIPIVYYETKTCLIYNTYFKSLFKQNTLLLINICVLIAAFAMYAVSGALMNLNMMVASMVLALVLRSLFMQYWLYRHYEIKQNYRTLFVDLALIVILICEFYIHSSIGFIVTYVLLVLPYCVLGHKEIRSSFLRIRQEIK